MWRSDPGSEGAVHPITQRPTLILSASSAGGQITALRIGTADLGLGINPATLSVCVVAAGGCGPNLAGAADPHGTVAVPLRAPLGDKEAEISATIKDLAGNETTVVRTVGWLLDSPPPPVPALRTRHVPVPAAP